MITKIAHNEWYKTEIDDRGNFLMLSRDQGKTWRTVYHWK